MARTTQSAAAADPRLTPNATWQDPETHVYARGFGHRVRVALLGRQMSRGELAEELGIQTNYVQAWVSGRRLPSLPMLPKLCEALNVDAHWLLGLQRNRETLGNLPDVLPQKFSIDDSADDLDKVGWAYLEMAREAWRLATMRRMADKMTLSD